MRPVQVFLLEQQLPALHVWTDSDLESLVLLTLDVATCYVPQPLLSPFLELLAILVHHRHRNPFEVAHGSTYRQIVLVLGFAASWRGECNVWERSMKAKERARSKTCVVM